MTLEFEVSAVVPATQAAVYEAWLDSETHSLMTGGAAVVSDKEGESFEAWDGYIQGENLELEPPNRILQRWRTVEFHESDEDSLLEISLKSEGESTLVTIRHSNLPNHGMQYRQGWIDAYFDPMAEFFGRGSEGSIT